MATEVQLTSASDCLMRPIALYTACLLLAGCADLRQDPQGADELYDDPIEQVAVEEPVLFASRDDDRAYGLPREGQPSLADLIALLPSDGTELGEATIWVGADDVPSTDQCGGDGVNVDAGLPMTIEAVVTLHPRQYQKVAVCGQDERFYGTFVVEDDSGGIVVLRNSRVATFGMGDRVRLTVRALTFTFGRDGDTRAVLDAEVEPLPGVGDGTVLYTPQRGPFRFEDVGQTVQIGGWIYTPATDDNFNEMVVTSVEPGEQVGALEGELADCSAACIESCDTQCETSSACRTLCPLQCVRNDGVLEQQDVPVCWKVSLDVELGRRNAAPPRNAAIVVHGPVVNSFGRRMWVNRLGQMQVQTAAETTD